MDTFEAAGGSMDVMAGPLSFGPATLWGILLSVCKGETAFDDPNESENGSLDAATTDVEESESVEACESVGSLPAGPAILWGILLSEPTNFATTGVLDVDAMVKLWMAAGFDYQQPRETLEERRHSSTLTENTLDDDQPTPFSLSSEPPGPYTIRGSPGKGQGVFATRDLAKGERVLVDSPFLMVKKPYNDRKVLSEFERLPLAQRRQYMQLTCPERIDAVQMTDVMRIFEANCFNIGDRAAVFLTATRFNHSCLPNTYYSWSSLHGSIIFHSMVPIPAGEELTIRYGNPFLTCRERHAELRIYNFRCSCVACLPHTAFGQASESRRLAMKTLGQQIVMFQSMYDKALLVYGLRDPLTAILRLIEVIKEEGMWGELMTSYRDAAEYLKGRGNYEEALVYARLALEEEVVCMGEDSEVVRKSREYIGEIEGAHAREVAKRRAEEIEKAEKEETRNASDNSSESQPVDRNRQLPDAPKQFHEAYPHPQSDKPYLPTTKPEHEPEEVDNSDSAPQYIHGLEDTEEFESWPQTETGESYTEYEIMPTDDPISSQSSSPRLKRKK